MIDRLAKVVGLLIGLALIIGIGLFWLMVIREVFFPDPMPFDEWMVEVQENYWTCSQETTYGPDDCWDMAIRYSDP